MTELREDYREISALSARLLDLLDKYAAARQRLLDKKGENPEIQSWVTEMDKQASHHLIVTGKNEEEVAESRINGASGAPDIIALRLKHAHEVNLNLRAQLELHNSFLEEAIRLMEAKESAT